VDPAARRALRLPVRRVPDRPPRRLLPDVHARGSSRPTSRRSSRRGSA
jgi:hypothetical protein